MLGVVSFGHDALVHPVVAWIAVGVMLLVALVATHLARTDPELLRRPSLVATEAVLVLALAIADGWVFDPGHVFTTSQNLATEWPLIVATSVGVAVGPTRRWRGGPPVRAGSPALGGTERLLPIRPEAPRGITGHRLVLRSQRRADRLAGHVAPAIRGNDQPPPRSRRDGEGAARHRFADARARGPPITSIRS